MNNLPKAVIIGDLNMLRSFKKRDIPTLLLVSNGMDITRFSRYCHEWKVIPSMDHEKDIVEALVEIGKTEGNRPVLYYGEDAMLFIVSRNRDILQKYFRFFLPEENLIEDCTNKSRFSSLAKKYDLPIPKQVISDDIDSVLDVLDFPLIIKPSAKSKWHSMHTAKNLFGGKPSKMIVANNVDELQRAASIIHQYDDQFVVQEYINGGEDCIYSYHTYINQEGNRTGWYVGKKIRTYPHIGGESTYIELVDDDEVARIGQDVLDKLGVRGVVKIDFKKDSINGKLYLLELNLRFNLWNYLGSESGINLPEIVYKDLCGIDYSYPDTYRKGLRWLSFGGDFRGFLHDYRKHGITTFQWASSFLTSKVYDVFSWSDPYPFIVRMARRGKGLMRRGNSAIRNRLGHSFQP